MIVKKKGYLFERKKKVGKVVARLNYEKSWKKAKNLGKILLSTKKSWPIKEKLGVFARSIGQDFCCKSLGPRLFQKKRDKV